VRRGQGFVNVALIFVGYTVYIPASRLLRGGWQLIGRDSPTNSGANAAVGFGANGSEEKEKEEHMKKRNSLRWPALAGSLLALAFAGNAWAAISITSATWQTSQRLYV
jgi:hypothetical protein